MMIGGFLQIAHFGAGPYSLDARKAGDPKMLRVRPASCAECKPMNQHENCNRARR